MADSLPLLQPTPRRRVELTPTSTESSSPPTPFRQRSDSSYLDAEMSEARRTRSILNLTSSTLVGIFSHPGDENARLGLSSPRSTGAHTPARLPNGDGRFSPVTSAVTDSKSRPQNFATPPRHSSARNGIPPLVLRLVFLFCSGMAYGLIVRHLHDRRQLAPMKMDQIDRSSWGYFILWGGGGVIIGSLMPWVDSFWEKAWGKEENPDAAHMSSHTPISSGDEGANPLLGSRKAMGGDWDTVVRGVGAFVGIAFAIVSSHSPRLEISLTRLQRKLPWQSTLQVSLTLALVNPVLWYLIDRSKPGFCVSSFVGIFGTAVVLGVSPDLVPTPTSSLSSASSDASFNHAIPGGFISHEIIGVWTWMASVLFCSALCFGNIGRRLVLGHLERRANTM